MSNNTEKTSEGLMKNCANYTFDKRQHMHDDLAYALALACLAAREYGVKDVGIIV